MRRLIPESALAVLADHAAGRLAHELSICPPDGPGSRACVVCAAVEAARDAEPETASAETAPAQGRLS